MQTGHLRKTTQFLLPQSKQPVSEGEYDIYPSFPIGENLIFSGYESLASLFIKHRVIIIDGYNGVFFEVFKERIERIIRSKGLSVGWISTSDFLKTDDEINTLVSPFMGGDDPLFGKKADLALGEFFNLTLLQDLEPLEGCDISIIAGPGASLSGWEGLLVYIDLPKNEIQFRSRAASVTNLGAGRTTDPKEMYKRSYFVDWPVLNRHKAALLPLIDVMIDGQDNGSPAWITGDNLRLSVGEMSKGIFRARPWFEPGAWGGTWIKDHIPGLNMDVPNYAWSFELISPENGLIFESSGKLLEVSFDTLMYLNAEDVLGDCHVRFRYDFPIRFDFLDTFNGGNLSIQCHPRPVYALENFGESFTQEETYYILDAKSHSKVYLGFNDDIDSGEFRNVLEASFTENKPVDIDKYVQKHDSAKHDLFLIPYGTIHGSGKDNLVLEISSTPYIFTFKMYDWLRPDLDGRPRPLNIERGMQNLFFDRKGIYVKEKLISHPLLLEKHAGWELWHLPTHETHIYDVHRYVIRQSAQIETGNKFRVLNLVEGKSISVRTASGSEMIISYAETFIIPAAAGSFTLVNRHHGSDAIVVAAFIK